MKPTVQSSCARRQLLCASARQHRIMQCCAPSIRHTLATADPPRTFSSMLVAAGAAICWQVGLQRPVCAEQPRQLLCVAGRTGVTHCAAHDRIPGACTCQPNIAQTHCPALPARACTLPAACAWTRHHVHAHTCGVHRSFGPTRELTLARLVQEEGAQAATVEWRAAREDYRAAAKMFQRLKNLSGAIFATGNAALAIAQLGDDARAFKVLCQSVCHLHAHNTDYIRGGVLCAAQSSLLQLKTVANAMR